MANQGMTDQERMNDSLAGQKLISGTYNTFASECENVNLKNDFLDILKEEQCIQTDIFQAMQQRGWYQPAPAESAKITQTHDKFKNML